MKCGVYVRVSTVGQKDNYSSPYQRQRGQDFCRQQGFEAVLYEEQASGASLLRQQLQAMLTAVEDGELGGIWVIEFSRLSRDEQDAIDLRKLLVRNKTRLFIDGQETDLTKPESIFLYGINSVVSSYERARTLERISRGVKQRMDDGEYKHSSLFGYDYVYERDGTKKVLINKREAQIVKLVFNWYEEGWTYTQISRELSRQGAKTKLGVDWIDTRIGGILHQPSYMGYQYDSKKVLIPSKVFTPIVEKTQWHKVQKIIAKNYGDRGRADFRRGKHELSSIIHCGICGTAFYYRRTYKVMKAGRLLYKEFYTHITKTLKGHECPQKPKYLVKKLIDKLMHALYVECFTNEAEIKKYLEMQQKEVRKQRERLDKSLGTIQQRLAEIEKERKKIITMVQRGMVSIEEVSDNIAELNAEKKKLENSLVEASENVRMQEASVDSLIQDFKGKDNWDMFALNEVQRRELFMRRIKRCEFKDRTLTVEWITGKVDTVNTKAIPSWLQARMETINDLISKKP